jgi:hypothetical protein
MLRVAFFKIMLNVVMLNVVMLSVVMLNVIMLNVVMLNVVMMSVITLSVIMLNVIMLSVVVLNVVAPLKTISTRLFCRNAQHEADLGRQHSGTTLASSSQGREFVSSHGQT